MIELQSGDLLAAKADALVNTVNCDGFMGRGIAAQFKRAYPENFKRYESACKRGEVVPGKMFIVTTGKLDGPKCIINFPTKRHWRSKSRIEDIEAGLVALVNDVARLGLRSVAVPPLGCGLGGLNWADVEPLVVAAFAKVPDVRVLLFAPQAAPEAEAMVKPPTPVKMTAGRAVLVGLVDHYIRILLDPFISLLEVHKLTYFSQEAGEPLRLKFVEGPYGPYAENLKNVLQNVEGSLIQGFADGGDQPAKQLELLPGAADSAAAFLRGKLETRERFERVAELVHGFETSFGMELLTTVHWVVTRRGAKSRDEAVEFVYDWNNRKRELFDGRQVRLAYDLLNQKGWFKPDRRRHSAHAG